MLEPGDEKIIVLALHRYRKEEEQRKRDEAAAEEKRRAALAAKYDNWLSDQLRKRSAIGVYWFMTRLLVAEWGGKGQKFIDKHGGAS